MAGRGLGVWDLVTLGATLVGCLVGGLVIGLLLDHRFDALPLYTLVGIAVGIVSGAAITYLRIREFLRD
ncbi:MAG: AtpZ/AtpI family protein [Mycobacteriales bacterium]